MSELSPTEITLRELKKEWRAGWKAELRQILNILALQDDGDPLDIGYMQAIEDVRAWIRESS